MATLFAKIMLQSTQAARSQTRNAPKCVDGRAGGYPARQIMVYQLFPFGNKLDRF